MRQKRKSQAAVKLYAEKLKVVRATSEHVWPKELFEIPFGAP